MKRGAERQLTKDDPDGGDGDGDDTESQAFLKADESALAKRQLRSLPKRALAAARPPSLNGLPPGPTCDADKAESVPTPKFGGFVGFGTRTPNPFIFTAQPPPDTASRPAQSTTAFAPPKQPSFDTAPPPKPPMPPTVEETDAMAFKYFKSLRGLNVSFLSALSAAVEKDPFLDVANLTESYKNLRTTIQSEFDGSPQPSTTPDSVPTNPSAKAPQEKPPSLFPLSKPSMGSAEAPSKLAPIGENGTKTSGFTFPPFLAPTTGTPAQLPFGLSSKPSETSPSITPLEPPKSALIFGAPQPLPLTSNVPPSSGLSSATIPTAEGATSKSVLHSASQETEVSSAFSSSRLASTVPSFGSTSVPNFFSGSKPANVFGTSDVASRPTSVFGGSVFGSTGANNPSPFASTPSDNKDSVKINVSVFGSATTSSTSTSIFGSSSDKPADLFGSASPPKNNAFTFGKPGGSIGNPVGFGFGSSSPSIGEGTTPGMSGSGFNFGAPPVKPSESLFSPPPTDKSAESTPQPDAEGDEEGEDATKLLPSYPHDEEGEGEEDEETVHAARCKVYRLSKSEDKGEWKDLGIGMFRVKKHKVTNVRRVLMRNSNTGRILINFRLYGSLKPSMAKTSISFIGYDNNTPTSFRIRVKTEEQARELKEALEREIAEVQTTA